MSQDAPAVRFVNIPALGRAPGDSHLAEVRGGRKVFVSGQIAVDDAHAVVGVGDFTAQARQVFENIVLTLAAVDLTFHAVVKLTFFLTDFAHLADGTTRPSRRAAATPRARWPGSTLRASWSC